MSLSAHDNTNTRVAPELEQDEVHTNSIMTGPQDGNTSGEDVKGKADYSDEGGYYTDTTAARQSSANTQSESEREPFWKSI
jgi:hypothetical protein